MAGEGLCIDPVSEDSGNVPLDIADNVSLFLLDHAYPPPDTDAVRQSSADTEGDRPVQTRQRNRTVSARLRVIEGGTAGGPYTNLVTNPSFEIDTTGYAVTGSGLNAGATLSQSSTYSNAGTYSGKVITTAALANEGARYPLGVLAAGTYSISLAIRGDLGTEAVQFIAGAVGGGSTIFSGTLSTAFSTKSGTFTSDGVTASHFYVRSTGAAALTWYMDSVIIVSGSTLPTYFDGDTPGAAWATTRHASTSTLAATGGPRLQKIVFALQQKVDKIRRECGTLKRTLPSGTTITFNVLNATLEIANDRRMVANQRTEAVLTFECLPAGLGDWITLSAHTETTNPCLVFTETGIKGDLPALGKLVITEADADDQAFLMWGIQSRYYSSSVDAALFYEAEARTAMGGSATAAGPSGASGGGSNVMRSAGLTTSYLAILSTQATGGGNHLAHIGDYRVWARVQTPTANTGAVSLAMEWAEGDFRRWTRNDATTFPADHWDNTWRLVDLGQVSLTQVAQGTQRWEGRVIAKSTVVGDKVDVDCLFLVPITEGSGQVRGLIQAASPTAFLARDEFDQAAGTLAGKTLPVGGTWASGGDPDDLSVETTGHTAQRTAVSDGAYHFAIAGTTTAAPTAVQVDFKSSAQNTNVNQGVFARYVDANNYVAAYFFPALVYLDEVVAGTARRLGYVFRTDVTAGSWYTIKLMIDSSERCVVYFGAQGSVLSPIIYGNADNATATGKFGIFDSNSSATANTRNYDNFLAWSPPDDAAMFASQSLEIRHDRVLREDSAGTLWPPPSKYEGDYLRIPPSQRGSRTLQVIVKGSRSDPDVGPDSGIDDITATLSYRPRYLILPE
jgi:hypothetical protein